jgi:short-subunit dehydrogenase
MSRALVTGASSGIGRCLAGLLAADKHDVVVVARRVDRLEQLQRELEGRHGVRVECITADLAEAGAAERVFARAPDVEILVNNAGFSEYGLFADQDLPCVRDMLQVNVMALTELTRLYVDPMRARGRGKILQVASTAAFQPGPRMAVYYASKAYVLSFSEALAVELDGSGVTVTTLCPGPTDSEFNAVAHYPVTPLVERVMMSSEEVAQIGYRGMMRGERLVIAGARNKLTAVASQLGPRSLVLAVTDRLMRGRS